MKRPNLEKQPSQTDRIVNLLRSRSPEWVPLPEILDMRPRISQFSARVWEARHRWGLPIENKVEIVGGQKHSWFRLIESNQNQPKTSVYSMVPLAHAPGSLFGELAPESRYPD